MLGREAGCVDAEGELQRMFMESTSEPRRFSNTKRPLNERSILRVSCTCRAKGLNRFPKMLPVMQAAQKAVLAVAEARGFLQRDGSIMLSRNLHTIITANA